MTLRQQGASFGPSIGASIRGIGQFDFSPAFEPGVGIYVDDVYYSRADRRESSTCSISSGSRSCAARRARSQGRTRSAARSALITRRPDADGGGFVEASYGSRNLISVRGGATFTIADGLYARISGSARQQSGFVDQIDYGCSHPGSGVRPQRGATDCLIDHFGGVGYTAVRGSLRYHPNPNIDIMLSGDYTHDSRTNAAEVLVAAQPPGNTLNIGPAFGPQFICGRYCNYAQFNQPAIVWAGPFAAGIPAGRDHGRPTSPRSTAGASRSMRTSAWPTTGCQIQSITAYRNWNNRFNTDDDLSPSNIGFGQNALDYWFWSQEVRLNADLASNLT